MRHLGSILLAVLAAPLALLLAGRGIVGLGEAAAADLTDYFGFATSGSALGLAGLLYALLTVGRFSPLGPALAGAAYLAFGIWALTDPAALVERIRWDLVGLRDEQVAIAAAIAPLLAVPLLVTLFVPARWRRKDRPAGAAPGPGAGLSSHTLDDIPRVPAAPAGYPMPMVSAPPAVRYGTGPEPPTIPLRPPADPDTTPYLGIR